MGKVEIHPAANLFPMMPADELSELADDIKERGLLEPISLFDGKLLDGRNRQIACEMAGVQPRYEDVEISTSPTQYVVSKNLHRRHLTNGQRAAIAAEMQPLLQKEARERQLSGKGPEDSGGRGHKKNLGIKSSQGFSSNNTNNLENQKVTVRGKSREIAAAIVGIGAGSVQRARKVMIEDPEVFENLKSGTIQLGDALRKATTGKCEKTKRQEIIENAAKDRMISVLSRIHGLCQGITNINVEFILQGCTEQEIRQWSSSAFESAKKIRAIAKSLRNGSRAKD